MRVDQSAYRDVTEFRHALEGDVEAAYQSYEQDRSDGGPVRQQGNRQVFGSAVWACKCQVAHLLHKALRVRGLNSEYPPFCQAVDVCLKMPMFTRVEKSAEPRNPVGMCVELVSQHSEMTCFERGVAREVVRRLAQGGSREAVEKVEVIFDDLDSALFRALVQSFRYIRGLGGAAED